MALSGMAYAAGDENDGGTPGATGLPLPRYVSLRANEVNLRTGPGTRYPIDWVFRKRWLPLEITAEYDMWRRVRDSGGTEGWVHKASLSGKRTAIVFAPSGDKALRDLHRDDDGAAPVLARLEPGAIGQLLACGKAWCRLNFNNVKGWLHKTDLWGVYPDEVFD
jgi:SH3-like domain-containing protein